MAIIHTQKSVQELQAQLAHATALLRDASMYVGSKAHSAGLSSEIHQFLKTVLSPEMLAQPAIAVHTAQVQAPSPRLQAMLNDSSNIEQLQNEEGTTFSWASALAGLTPTNNSTICSA